MKIKFEIEKEIDSLADYCRAVRRLVNDETMTEVAMRAGNSSRQYIYALERGVYPMTPESMAKVLIAYKIKESEVSMIKNILPLPRKYVKSYQSKARDVYFESLTHMMKIEKELMVDGKNDH